MIMDFFALNIIEVFLLSVISFVHEGRTNAIVTTTPEIPPDIRLITHLCPEQTNSTDINLIEKIRYHAETRRCYTLRSQGPCGSNMVFYAKDNIYGECDCSLEERLLIYHKQSKQCYYIFEKAYCNKNQWLFMTREGKPVCVRNPCATLMQTSGKELVEFNGTCAEIGKSSGGCQHGEVIGFLKNKRLPACISSRSLPMSTRSMGVPTTPCNVGSVMAIEGICNPPFDFD